MLFNSISPVKKETENCYRQQREQILTGWWMCSTFKDVIEVIVCLIFLSGSSIKLTSSIHGAWNILSWVRCWPNLLELELGNRFYCYAHLGNRILKSSVLIKYAIQIHSYDLRCFLLLPWSSINALKSWIQEKKIRKKLFSIILLSFNNCLHFCPSIEGLGGLIQFQHFQSELYCIHCSLSL